MYVPARIFSIQSQKRATGLRVATLGGCVLLSGCVGNPFGDAKVDPQSPIAAEVAKVVRSNRDYPSFASIPAAPTDVRPPAQYGRAAKAVEQARSDLEQATAPGTWSLAGTEGFAAHARTQAGSEAAPQNSGDTAAFANAQRKRATPPPPPSN